MIDEAASIEAAEASIDAFIGRRARANDAENAREMMWKASVRKHHERLRQERLWGLLAYHRQQIEAHTATFEALLKRHRVGLRVVEEALGIATEEGDNAAGGPRSWTR